MHIGSALDAGAPVDESDGTKGWGADAPQWKHGYQEAQMSAELTDGFHLVADALKLNGVNTI